MITILSGIVGSTAYGLAREGSDVDRLGVFVAPALEVAGLDWSPGRESRVSTRPDVALHEVRKYLSLALACNPTVLELLWLPAELIDVATDEGRELIALGPSLVFEQGVRSAYGGYARQQAAKLAARGDSTFSAGSRGRTAKHARHTLRLLRQGRHLLETGRLEVRVPDPQEYWAFDEMPVDRMLEIYQREDELFRDARSVLPPAPDRDAARAVLDRIRAAHLR